VVIARLADCNRQTVGRARRQLEETGAIPARNRPPEPPVYTPILPKMPPEMANGLCTRAPDPDLWSSRRPAERAAAVKVCQRCPALEPCREWSLNLPVRDESTIWGGMTGAQRIRLKRRRKAYAPGSPQAGPQDRCSTCGRQLSGANLVIMKDASEREFRACRWCKLRANREAKARARARRHQAAAAP
jgi:hypothetical protein